MVELQASGGAFVDLSFWRKVSVTGPEAAQWLNDLVSADVGSLAPGHAQRSLLLSPTGRIRAEFTVARRRNGFVLLQDPSQPASILDLLSPYTLSSHVELGDDTDRLALFVLPGVGDLLQESEAETSVPSCLGSGTGLLAPDTSRDHLSAWLRERYAEAGAEAVETWRILAGLPRVGVDALEDDLPQEAAMEGAVAFGQGLLSGPGGGGQGPKPRPPQAAPAPPWGRRPDLAWRRDPGERAPGRRGHQRGDRGRPGRRAGEGSVGRAGGPVWTRLGVELRPRPVS